MENENNSRFEADQVEVEEQERRMESNENIASFPADNDMPRQRNHQSGLENVYLARGLTSAAIENQNHSSTPLHTNILDSNLTATTTAATNNDDDANNTQGFYDEKCHHNYEEDEDNSGIQNHSSYKFRPNHNHTSSFNNDDKNDNFARAATALVGHDNNCHDYKDDRNYQERTNKTQENNHNSLHIDIDSRKLVQPLEMISPSSSLIADDDTTHATCNDHGMIEDDLHNSASLENLPDTANLQNSSDISNIISHNNHNHDTSSQSSMIQSPPPPPPPPSEQTAREQLIERERQGRLERERARLKQQLALSRERDEEDEAYAEFDRVRERIASIDNNSLDNSLDVMDLTDVEEEDDIHQTYNGEQGTVTNDSRNHNLLDIVNNVENEQNVSTVTDISTRVNTLGTNTGAVPANSSISEMVHDSTIMAPTIRETNINDNETTGNDINEDLSPLGFTMERFLQDGVVVSPTDDSRTSGGPINGGETVNNNSSTEVTLTGGIEDVHHDVIDQQTDNDSNTNHQLVDLTSESSNTITGTADMSIAAGAVNSSELVPSPPISRIGSSDVGGSSIGGGDGGGSSTNRNEREYAFNDNAPRLARLTEAEILELAEIDYASVGNMPPRSERDEQHLPSIHDLSGLGRMSNISDQTHTTMLESMSMASADIDISQSEANSRTSTSIGHADGYTNSPVIDTSLGTGPSTANSLPPFASMTPMEQIERFSVPMIRNDTGDNRISTSIGHTDGYTHSPVADTSLGTGSSVNRSLPPFAAMIPMEQIERFSAPMSRSNIGDEKDEYPTKMPPKENETTKLNCSDTDLKPSDLDYGNLKPPALVDGDLKSPSLVNVDLPNNGFRLNLDDGAVEILNEQDESNETYNLPNRIIRPGIVKASTPTNSIHRRSQTTPNIPNFIDGFDYSKYKDPYDKNDLDQAEALIANEELLPLPTGTHQSDFKDYGATTLQHDINQDLHVHSQSGSDEDYDEETRELIAIKRNRRESIDVIVQSVFSSVRSMSTEDIEADINDCDKYLRSNMVQRGT